MGRIFFIRNSRRVKKFYSCILTELYLQVGDEKPGDSEPSRWVCGELTSTEIWGRSKIILGVFKMFTRTLLLGDEKMLFG